ncbi:MAG: ERF family protein [Patescibacteria group bacterium]|nr:ERF family protein [Patescibacteria group bacterium]
MTEQNIYSRLMAVQKELKAPKSLNGRFGAHRSAEQILEAAKPILDKHELGLILTDTIVQVGERNYVKAIARAFDAAGETIEAAAEAWEGEISRGLDASQVTGMASSYARKYALGGLFALDDNKDADHNTPTPAKTVPKTVTDLATDKQRQLIALKLKERGEVKSEEDIPGHLIEEYGVSLPLTKEAASGVLDMMGA